MAMSASLQRYLQQTGVPFELVPHTYTNSSLRAAESARVSGDRLAKPVLFEDEKGYVMAVVPATHRVDPEQLRQTLHRSLVQAKEQELGELFRDCAKGAVPPVGQAYGVEVVWDDSLSACPDVYFEAGDHTELVHLSGKDFRRLMENAPHAALSRPH